MNRCDAPASALRRHPGRHLPMTPALWRFGRASNPASSRFGVVPRPTAIRHLGRGAALRSCFGPTSVPTVVGSVSHCRAAASLLTEFGPHQIRTSSTHLSPIRASLTRFDGERVEHVAVDRDEFAVEARLVRFEAGERLTVPSRVGVASGVQQHRVASVVDGRPVTVAEDDQVGVAFPTEHRQAGVAAVASVGDGDADALVLQRRRGRESVSDARGVGVAVDASEVGGDVVEGIEGRFGREVACVDYHVGVGDGVAGRADESMGVGSVGVREDDEHGRRWDGRGKKPADVTFRSPVVGRWSPTLVVDSRTCRPDSDKAHPRDGPSMAGSTGVVIAALFANGAIAILKFGGFLLTGSPSMLSETYHSISDTGNQVFLLVGIRYSKKEADRGHPFGYGKAQFFYSFLVSVLLFGIAGWESLKHGWDAIQHPGHGGGGTAPNLPLLGTVDTYWINVAILISAILFETYAFVKAREELLRQMKAYEWTSLREAFRKTSDVTTLTAFTEDAVALGGAAIALVGITLARYLENPIYDAISAVVIGVLLMGFAVALAWENKRLLLGESVPSEVEAELRAVVESHEGVTHVDHFRSVFFGPGSLLVAADVSFDATLDTEDLDADIDQIETKLREADDRVKTVYIEPEL